jgi:hypothetical protein
MSNLPYILSLFYFSALVYLGYTTVSLYIIFTIFFVGVGLISAIKYQDNPENIKQMFLQASLADKLLYFGSLYLIQIPFGLMFYYTGYWLS